MLAMLGYFILAFKRKVSKVVISPVVTVLEGGDDGIHSAKFEELKAAILKIAFKGEDKPEEKIVYAEEKEDVAKVVQASSDEVATGSTERVEPLEPRKIVLPLQPNSLDFTHAGRKTFDSFIDKLLHYPRATILVKGYVSSQLLSPGGIKLSEERALHVYTLLLKEGVAPEQITIEGMGNREPIASNDTRAGRAQNRRVEIVVISDGL